MSKEERRGGLAHLLRVHIIQPLEFCLSTLHLFLLPDLYVTASIMIFSCMYCLVFADDGHTCFSEVFLSLLQNSLLSLDRLSQLSADSLDFRLGSVGDRSSVVVVTTYRLM